MDERDLVLDGNAIGGLLLEIFSLEMTSVRGTCASCGAVEPLAAVTVYLHGPGTVVRCPHCKQVLMRIVRGRTRTWLDLRGVRCLELPAPD